MLNKHKRIESKAEKQDGKIYLNKSHPLFFATSVGSVLGVIYGLGNSCFTEAQ